MDLGTSIQNFRKQRGLTQGELATRCGITQTYLSQIENNQKEPNLSVLKTISENLKVPLPILFFNAMTTEDIPVKKRKAYEILSPSIKSFVSEFFTV